MSFIETTRLFNILPFNYAVSGATDTFCNIFQHKMCDLVISLFADRSIEYDNTEREAVYMSFLPAGNGYRVLDHFSQLAQQPIEIFQRYDWGREGNMYFYNQTTPQQYDLSKVRFPIAILSGKQDKVANAKDVEWTYDQLKDNVVFFRQYDMSHDSFSIAKNMDWFRVDSMAILNYFNKKCDKKTEKSNFDLGNLKCMESLGFEDDGFLTS